jgi:hypothetical protein
MDCTAARPHRPGVTSQERNTPGLPPVIGAMSGKGSAKVQHVGDDKVLREPLGAVAAGVLFEYNTSNAHGASPGHHVLYASRFNIARLSSHHPGGRCQTVRWLNRLLQNAGHARRIWIGWEGEAPAEPQPTDSARLGRSLALPKTFCSSLLMPFRVVLFSTTQTQNVVCTSARWGSRVAKAVRRGDA